MLSFRSVLSDEIARETEVRRRVPLHRDYFYGVTFALIALAILPLTSRGGLSFILLWPALSFAIVAVAYFSDDARWFGKRVDGSRSLPATVSLLPYLFFAHLVWLLQISISREPAVGTVNPFVSVSRRLRSRELPEKLERVCDLTCELVDPRAIRSRARYICHPILDAGACTADELIELARRLPPQDGCPVLIHCANGHGRTGMVAAVWLLTHGFVTTVEDALQLLQDARPGIRLRSRQRNLVSEARKKLLHDDADNHERIFHGGVHGET